MVKNPLKKNMLYQILSHDVPIYVGKKHSNKPEHPAW